MQEEAFTGETLVVTLNLFILYVKDNGCPGEPNYLR